MDGRSNNERRSTGHNKRFVKLAVQWLNEALCFVSSSVLADSFVIRNRQLLVTANSYGHHCNGRPNKTTIIKLIFVQRAQIRKL